MTVERENHIALKSAIFVGNRMIDKRQFIVGSGSAAAWPITAWAQLPKLPVVGLLG